MLSLVDKRAQAGFHIKQLVANKVYNYPKILVCNPAQETKKEVYEPGSLDDCPGEFHLADREYDGRYSRWLLKISASLLSASYLLLSVPISRCKRLTTPQSPT